MDHMPNEQRGEMREEQFRAVSDYLDRLCDISQDPYYDQYLEQMKKDLASGKATPAQVRKEADRTYRLYQERMTASSGRTDAARGGANTRRGMEFKIGTSVFALIGAAFVLIAFLILGLNYLEGIWQGLSLYGCAGVILLLSELLLRKINRSFATVVTGIGIAGLYIATIVNAVVLQNIPIVSGLVITVCIAVFSLLLQKNKTGSAIRLISLMGCYICLVPLLFLESWFSEGEGELLLPLTLVLPIVNLAAVLLRGQKDGAAADIIHMLMHTVFTGVVLFPYCGLRLLLYVPVKFVRTPSVSMQDMVYLLFFGVALAIPCLITCCAKEKSKLLCVFFGIVMSIMWLYLAAFSLYFCFLGIDGATHQGLLMRFLLEVIAFAVLGLFFFLTEDRKVRIILIYFAAATVLLLNGYLGDQTEAMIAYVLLLFAIRACAVKQRSMRALDDIVTPLFMIQMFSACVAGEWYAAVYLAVWFVTMLLIRHSVLYLELVTALGGLFACDALMSGDVSLKSIAGISLYGIDFPGIMLLDLLLIVLLMRLYANREKHHKAVTIVLLAVAAINSFNVVLEFSWYFKCAAAVIGSILIAVVFREKYGILPKRRYLILFLYLYLMILLADIPSQPAVLILQMLVAVSCIGVGFAKRDITCRILGLIMAGIVCWKVLLQDVFGLSGLIRAILFLVIGVIALVISFLYSYLEGKARSAAETEENINVEAEGYKTVKTAANETVVTKENIVAEIEESSTAEDGRMNV